MLSTNVVALLEAVNSELRSRVHYTGGAQLRAQITAGGAGLELADRSAAVVRTEVEMSWWQEWVRPQPILLHSLAVMTGVNV